jgi:RNA 2',3'-cyclic 3'-phosphodiesterase
MMRLFIALPLSREIEESLGKLIFVLKQKGGPVKWVAPKNIHLTVKFLGEVDEIKVNDIKAAVEKTAAKYRMVESTVEKIGAFPDFVRPRVIWAGMTGGIETIDGMVKDIEDAMAALGFPREDKRFKPHITLGRVKENYGLGDLISYIKSYHLVPMPLNLESLVLFQSTLTPRGPIYDRLLEVPLHK